MFLSIKKGAVNAMKILIGVGLVFAVTMLAVGQARKGESGGGPGNVEHGRYIVHDVVQCIQCHSPRDENGALLTGRLLMGAPIPLRSPFPGQEWAFHAPRIAGMPGYTEEEGIRLLTHGITRNGQPPRPPMLQFHMTDQDARDVVAYLKSLQ
jgi:mono/diheme cytochrome c family protein